MGGFVVPVALLWSATAWHDTTGRDVLRYFPLSFLSPVPANRTANR